MSRGRLSQRSQLGVLLLAGQLMNFGLENVPPATLALIVAQSAIFLDVFPKQFPSAEGVCMSSFLVYHHRDWLRMILGSLYHANDLHLYYNMISLLYKGSYLEKKLGTPYFIYLISIFTVLTSAVYVGLGIALSNALDDNSYLTTCAVGFSGVLFALKVLSTHYSPSGTQYVMGFIPVPSKHIYWAELLIIQMLVPNASFVGHLAGILVGVAYIWGPLKFFMDIFLQPGSFQHSRRRRRTPSPQRPRTYYNYSGRASQGAPTYSAPSAPPYSAPSAPPYDPYSESGYDARAPRNDYQSYTGGLDEDEQYARAVEESMRYSDQPSNQQGLYPSLDELRSRRSQFYH